MLGWLGILAGLSSWVKESYDRSHPKYSSPQAERYFTQKTKKDIGFQRMMADLDTIPRHERDRRRALGYYDGENVDIKNNSKYR